MLARLTALEEAAPTSQHDQQKITALEARLTSAEATNAVQDKQIKALTEEKQNIAEQTSKRMALIQSVQDSLAAVDAQALVKMPVHKAGARVPGAKANVKLTCGSDYMINPPKGKHVVFGQSDKNVMVAIDPTQGDVHVHGKILAKGCAEGVCEKVTELVGIFSDLLNALKEE